MSLTKDQAHSRASGLAIETLAFINGSFTASSDGGTFESVNPATGETLCAVAHCTAEDVDRAVAAARARFNDGVWSRAAPEDRKAVLLKLSALIRANAADLAVLESLDSGKTITDCLHEIGTEVANFFQWYGELADKSFGKVAPTGEDALALIVKEPAGVVGLVLPWNFPLLMAAWKLAPALAAGCSCLVKPAEQTPLSILRLAALAQEAGVPDGVLSVLPGMGETTGQAIGRHGDIDIVSFTGSTEVGGYFLRYAGESNLKVIGLEMGGKSPFIVLDDADLSDDLINHAVNSAFWNGGQNCSANMRQIVDARVAEAYLEKVTKRAAAYKVGDPLDPDTDIGAMVTAEHMARVTGYIDKGVAEGARMTTGGARKGAGFFVEPTVFAGLTPDMAIAREEIFGPVLGILPVKTMDEALQLAADSDYGLHATVFTRDIDRALHMARRLPCGTVSVNGFSEGDIKTPFGGYKRSGSLARDNGVEAMEQYLQTKTIWICQGTPS
ncbi:aldehyde dehydrogenase [Nioella sediminis]|jgi:aldehyde dehydrogenase (NAD+)/gamma-glutamyl-gamma-aminobutyraldehyde dehydrogenase|uniref:aldehyde dehydrogenase n=1 Tax=Nioella sediminis TaxID=1912092 RepID=UPI0008FD3733|nr:aldehyde dehydrogenase [Nioella sediminis]TBX15045.1 aldehyde dehydrogenase [Roseovarius sp. JS7-11]